MPCPCLSHLHTLTHGVLLPGRPASHSTRDSTWEAEADSCGSRSRPTGTVIGMDSWRATEQTGALSNREAVSKSTELSSDSPPKVREVDAGLQSRRAVQRAKTMPQGTAKPGCSAPAEAQPLRILDSGRDGGDGPTSGHGEARGRGLGSCSQLRWRMTGGFNVWRVSKLTTWHLSASFYFVSTFRFCNTVKIATKRSLGRLSPFCTSGISRSCGEWGRRVNREVGWLLGSMWPQKQYSWKPSTWGI